MGIFLSKKKETKRRPEGLMKQSKAIIGVRKMYYLVARPLPGDT